MSTTKLQAIFFGVDYLETSSINLAHTRCSLIYSLAIFDIYLVYDAYILCFKSAKNIAKCVSFSAIKCQIQML